MILNFLSFFILFISSLIEVLDDLEIIDTLVKSHHGLLVFGIIQSIKSFPECYENLKKSICDLKQMKKQKIK